MFLLIWLLTGKTDVKGYNQPALGTGSVSKYGHTLTLGIACLLPLAFYGRTLYRILAVLALLVAGYLFFSIGSRRTIISTSFVLLALLMFQKKISWQAIIVVLGLSMGVWLGWSKLVPSLPQVVQNRYSLNVVIESGGTGRVDIYQRVFEAWKTSPLAGIGLGSLPLYVSFAHNAYLEVLAETGLIGFALWGGAILLIVQRMAMAYRDCEEESERLLAAIPLALLVSLLSMGMVIGYYNYRFFWFGLGLAVATTKTLCHDDRREAQCNFNPLLVNYPEG